MLMFVTLEAKFWSPFAAGLVNFWLGRDETCTFGLGEICAFNRDIVRVHAVRFVVLAVFGGHGNGFVSFS